MNQEQPDGSMGLAVVTSAEWLAAVRQNKHLPMDQQGYFICPCLVFRLLIQFQKYLCMFYTVTFGIGVANK